MVPGVGRARFRRPRREASPPLPHFLKDGCWLRLSVDEAAFDAYRPTPSKQRLSMNKTQLKRFKALLLEKRDEIVKKAKQTLEEDMALDANDLPDEMDLASSEYLQSFTFRLRG